MAEGAVDNHLYVILRGSLGVDQERRHRSGVDDQHAVRRANSSARWGSWTARWSYAAKVALGDAQVLGLEREKLGVGAAFAIREIVYRVMRAIIRVVHQIQRRLSMQQVELSNYIYKQHGRY